MSRRLGRKQAIKVKAAFSKETEKIISVTGSEEIPIVHETETN